MSSQKATFQVNPEVIPKFQKTSPVPYRLENDSILKKVNHSTWPAPIVVVPDNMVNSILVGITRYYITLNYGRSHINTGSPLMARVKSAVIKLNVQYSAL